MLAGLIPGSSVSESFLERLADRVGVKNPQSAEQVLAAVDRKLAVARVPAPRTQAQIDAEFDRVLMDGLSSSAPPESEAEADLRAIFGQGGL